ncbi:MAG TPA: lipoprotein-releasing ABC transporter permease subunit [Aliidongia sp.]|nr:lipoprotein-releasing ABC transporter permease subunit [Aliidongia sp.]
MAFGPFERLVAFRYLRARREEGFVSVIAAFSLLGIMLGVGTLIVVMSVMNGFRAEFLKQILGFNGDLTVYAREGSLGDYGDITKALRAIPGVIEVTPMVEGQVVASAGNKWSAVQMRGVSTDDLKRQTEIQKGIAAGSIDALDENSVMLGGRLAATLGVRLGDTVSLLSPQGNVTAFGTVPRVKAYKLVGIFTTGTQYDAGFGFMSLGAAQLFFNVPSAVTAIQVFVDDPEQVWRYRGSVTTAAGPHARLYDWQSGSSPFLNAVLTERNVMFLILTMIIIVAAFNVVSSMIMLVGSKGRDIAVMRTMGATRGMIMRIFFLTGASIGIVGTLLGLGLGLAFAENIESIRQFLQQFTGTDLFNSEIYFLSQLPAKTDVGEVSAVVGMSFALSFLATIYPAWRAARLDPVEALRYE